MVVRRGIIAEVRPLETARLPSFRVSRPVQAGALFELFGGADGQPFTITVDGAVWVTHSINFVFDTAIRSTQRFALLADLRLNTGGRLTLLADTSACVSGTIVRQADARVRIGLRVTRQADLSQRIGVGAALSSDAATTVYRVILHEDHLILI